MNITKLEKIKLLGEFVLYVLMILFISSFFDLDLPTEVLLKTLKSKLLISIFFGAILVGVNYWALKKVRTPNQK